MPDQKMSDIKQMPEIPEGYQPDEALKLKHQLCFPLYAAARHVTNAYTPYLKPLGLTYTQYLVFLVLWEKDQISVNDICGALHLDSGTITPLLKKMEKAGYLTRSRDSADERRVIVRLTDAGHEMKKKAALIPLQVGSCLHLRADEIKKLYELLYKVMDTAFQK